jgi:pimeloyl-ACP methyl ester carboxylesterase
MRGLRAFLLACLVVTLAAVACGGGPPVPTATPTPAAPTPTPLATASPTAPAVAALDPAMTADELFADDTRVADLRLEDRSQEARDGAIVRDVHYRGADGDDVPAFLVVPSQGPPKAGILFLHWLGDDFSSRDEFVAEAVALAGQGVESALITQRFPWSDKPSGVDHDRVAIGYQVRSIRRALTLLADEVGTGKLAIVGHDYGCMYGILTASVDHRTTALACMTPDSTWVNWFATYFHVPAQADVAGFAQAMADLDPVTRIAQVRAPLLLQFGTSDFYVSSDVVQALTGAAPGGTDIHSYATGHRLDRAARADRDAWLLEELGIAVPG